MGRGRELVSMVSFFFFFFFFFWLVGGPALERFSRLVFGKENGEGE